MNDYQDNGCYLPFTANTIQPKSPIQKQIDEKNFQFYYSRSPDYQSWQPSPSTPTRESNTSNTQRRVDLTVNMFERSKPRFVMTPQMHQSRNEARSSFLDDKNRTIT